MTNSPRPIDTIWNRGSPCPYDAVIDVRSPSEFAEDHIPGAINLPVLSDEQRAEVGTLYHQVSAFEARKLGAALISANIATHLQSFFANQSKEFKPLLYCWRGGERSASMAVILARIGWPVGVLQGGYRTYRRHVLSQLDSVSQRFAYRIIAGETGTGKTRLLGHLQSRGEQILDLEAVAGHRGSLLGGLGPQPPQKLFESLLLVRLECLDHRRVVWVEAESNRIGDRFIPKGLWNAMQTSPGIGITMSLENRVQHLLADYQDFVRDPEHLKAIMERVAYKYGTHRRTQWLNHIDHGEWREFVASLLQIHYDPSYQNSLHRCFPKIVSTIPMHDVGEVSLDRIASLLIANGTTADPLFPPLENS